MPLESRRHRRRSSAPDASRVFGLWQAPWIAAINDNNWQASLPPLEWSSSAEISSPIGSAPAEFPSSGRRRSSAPNIDPISLLSSFSPFYASAESNPWGFTDSSKFDSPREDPNAPKKLRTDGAYISRDSQEISDLDQLELQKRRKSSKGIRSKSFDLGNNWQAMEKIISSVLDEEQVMEITQRPVGAELLAWIQYTEYDAVILENLRTGIYRDLDAQCCSLCLGVISSSQQHLLLTSTASSSRHFLHMQCINPISVRQLLLSPVNSWFTTRNFDGDLELVSGDSEFTLNVRVLSMIADVTVVDSDVMVCAGSDDLLVCKDFHSQCFWAFSRGRIAIDIAGSKHQLSFSANFDLNASFPRVGKSELRFLEPAKKASVSIIVDSKDGHQFRIYGLRVNFKSVTTLGDVLSAEHGFLSRKDAKIGLIGLDWLLSSIQEMPDMTEESFDPELNRRIEGMLKCSGDKMISEPDDDAKLVLPEFALSNLELLPLISGKVVQLAKTQSGSRFLQERVSDGQKQYIEIIGTEVYDNMVELMCDMFGNYLMQKLLRKFSSAQRISLLERLGSDMTAVCRDKQGTRVMQKIMQYVSEPDERLVIITALENDLFLLMTDPHGSYVINAIVENSPIEELSRILDIAASRAQELALHQHGLCVVKKCLSRVTPSGMPEVVSQVIESALSLVNNQYGNYLIQHVFELGDEKIRCILHDQFKGHYREFACQKFSSNVVEKCLNLLPAAGKEEVVAELMAPESIGVLLQDSFGNYVMQNALNTSQGAQCLELISRIRPILGILRKKIQAKWIRLLQMAEDRVNGIQRSAQEYDSMFVEENNASKKLSVKSSNGGGSSSRKVHNLHSPSKGKSFTRTSAERRAN